MIEGSGADCLLRWALLPLTPDLLVMANHAPHVTRAGIAGEQLPATLRLEPRRYSCATSSLTGTEIGGRKPADPGRNNSMRWQIALALLPLIATAAHAADIKGTSKIEASPSTRRVPR